MPRSPKALLKLVSQGCIRKRYYSLVCQVPSATSTPVVITSNHSLGVPPGVPTTQTMASTEQSITTAPSTSSSPLPSIAPDGLDTKHMSFPLLDVLGPILGVGVIACIGVLWLFYRRRRRRRAPSSMFERLKKLEKPTIADRLGGSTFAYSPLDDEEIQKVLARKNISRLSLPSELYVSVDDLSKRAASKL